VLQEIDCLAPVVEDSFPVSSAPLVTGAGEVLLELVPPHRSASSFLSVMMYQPVLEDALYGQLKRQEALAKIYQGWTVVSASQDAAAVRVRARPTGRMGDSGAAPDEIFECRYLIAADGATSSIRAGLGIEREDFGINERWLDIDMAYRRPCHFGPAVMVGDPRRPHFFSPLGKRHHRFECKLLPGESADEFSTSEKAWALLAQKGITADDVDIVRQAVYTFEYRLAQRWREGRIFLMGDAAHTMTPLLGQGMNSGIRDAANLGWKLDLVLRGLADDSILESYETERRPHVKAWADLSLMAGEFICVTDPEAAAARDARIRGGQIPAWRPQPTLTDGLLDFDPPEAATISGHLFPQRYVRQNGRAGLFDELAGSQFLLVARNDPRPFLSDSDRSFMERLGMRCAWVSATAGDAFAFLDEAGEYESFFNTNGLEALIVRPDHYVFGGIQDLKDIGGSIARLADMLQVREQQQQPRRLNGTA
jgi:2-polyprenyl-6-methoxyphenol hydroxylase-like FAD-dependent oxidoreductase